MTIDEYHVFQLFFCCIKVLTPCIILEECCKSKCCCFKNNSNINEVTP